MKRTPLSRKTPLKASTRLQRTGSLQRGAPIKSKPSESQRAKDAALPASRQEVMRRAAGRCEAQIIPVCQQYAAHVHHRQMRSQGGSHEPENLLAVCHPCHEHIHRNPADSYEAGHLVRKYTK